MYEQQLIHFPVDGVVLTGTLHLPRNERPPFVIGCHGLLSDRQSPKQIALADALNHIGIAFFRFDHRGCGESEGKLETLDPLSSRCQDLDQAIRCLRSRSEIGSFLGLFGSSFGGTVCIATAADIQVPAMITYAAPINSHIVKKPTVDDIIKLAGTVLNSRTDFHFDINQKLSKLSHILIVHGGADEIVPLIHAYEIYKIAKKPKKLVVFDGGDHRMSCLSHQRSFLAECVSWLESRLLLDKNSAQLPEGSD